MVWKDYSTQGNGKIIKVLDPVIVLNKVSSVAEAAAWIMYKLNKTLWFYETEDSNGKTE